MKAWRNRSVTKPNHSRIGRRAASATSDYDGVVKHDRPHQAYVGLRRAAILLGLPVSYLRDEAKAGRVPHLKIGRQYRINLKAVERELAARADALSASVREPGDAA